MGYWKSFIFSLRTNFSSYHKVLLRLIRCQNSSATDNSCHSGTNLSQVKNETIRLSCTPDACTSPVGGVACLEPIEGFAGPLLIRMQPQFHFVLLDGI